MRGLIFVHLRMRQGEQEHVRLYLALPVAAHQLLHELQGRLHMSTPLLYMLPNLKTSCFAAAAIKWQSYNLPCLAIFSI